MKRPTPLALISAALLTGLVGVTFFSNQANATRSIGVEAGDIAYVDVFQLVDRALSVDELVTVRDSYMTESNNRLMQMQQQVMTLQQQLQSMQPDDENIGSVYSQYQQLQGNMQQESLRANEGYQGMIAEQIAAAYDEIYAAVNEIAADQGIQYVFATRSNGELLQTNTITGITQEILARPLVTPPSGTDLTEAVRVKLGYPETSVMDIEPGAAGQPGMIETLPEETSETPATDPSEDN